MLAGAALAGVLGYYSARFGMDLLLQPPGPQALRLVVLGTLPLVWLVVVGLHELGHLAGGWAGGGRFLLWVVGPLMMKRTPGGVRFGWNWNVNVAGGMAACLPLEPARMTPRRVAVMILGGPMASLLLAVAALWIAVGMGSGDEPVSAAWALAQNVVVCTAGLSLLIFLVTAVPSAVGGFKSDGKRILDLLRGGPRADQEAALLMLTSASLAGIRPADFDPSLVARVVALGDGSLFDLYGRFTVYLHAADRADWAGAQAHLEQVLAGESKMVPFMRDSLRCEYAWLLATTTPDAATARAWLESAGKLDFDPATRLRAEAAVLLAEGKTAEAAVKAREGLHALEPQDPSPVVNRFACERLATVRARAEGRQVPEGAG